MFDISQLKQIRNSLKMTQSELAKQAGVSQSLITKLEAGLIDPKHSTVQRIEKAVENLMHRNSPTIADIMQTKIISAKADEPVPTIVKKMRKEGISQMPVFENGNPIGTITEDIILRAIAEEKELSKLTVSHLMEGPPPTLSEDTPLTVARHLLEYSQIILVQKKEKVIGVATKTDLINASL